VVDVDRGGADLARRDDRHGRLDGVVRVQPDMVPRANTQPRKVMGKPVGTLLELGVGHLPATADQGDPVTEYIDGMFKEVGEVPGHGYETRTCYCFGQPRSRVACDEEIPTR